MLHSGIDIRHERSAHITGDVCSKKKMLKEWDHASMFLYHKSDQETPMSKSGRQPFAQESIGAPQMCPLGPNFWSQNFSHTDFS